jgi:hypothetical protein
VIEHIPPRKILWDTWSNWAQIEDAVGQVTADAKIRLFCIDADLERAMEEDTL